MKIPTLCYPRKLRMEKFSHGWALGLLAVAGLCSPAWGAMSATSALPTGTLTFTAPTGQVGPTDSVPVMVQLTLTQDSAPFTLGPNGEIASSDYQEFADVLPSGFAVSSAYVSYSFTWGGTFSQNGISGPPYQFAFSNGAKLNGVSMQAGQTTSFEFGSYSPSSGPVAPGTYVGNTLSVEYLFTDNSQADPDGGPMRRSAGRAASPSHRPVQAVSSARSSPPYLNPKPTPCCWRVWA